MDAIKDTQYDSREASYSVAGSINVSEFNMLRDV